MSNEKCLGHKTGITASQCDMDRAWNTKYISHQSFVKWKVPGTENRYHTNQMSNGQDLKHKTGTTAAKCHEKFLEYKKHHSSLM